MFEHSELLRRIFDVAERTPEKTALVVDDKPVSYASLVQNILKAASFLLGEGLRKGDSVVVSGKKEVEFVYSYFAAHMIGVVNVVVDAEANQKKLDYILATIKPKLVLGFQKEGFRCVSFSEIPFDRLAPLTSRNDLTTVAPDDVADILFTTGTTGAPKGVLLTHKNAISSVDNINGFIQNDASDVEALGLPLSHSFGLGRMKCVLSLGGTLVVLGNFANIKKFFEAIERYSITGFGMVPAVWTYLRKFSGSRISKYGAQIRYLEIGGAPMPIEQKRELRELFPNARICMYWGLTEASRSSFMEIHSEPDRMTSIGKPVSKDVDIKIFNENGEEVPFGQTGEVCVAGSHVTKGYLLKTENDDVFFGKYFRTGDWGYKDADGYLYFEGRKKEMINVGGEKVSPVEVEDAICSLGIEDCVCAPTRDPRGILGEVVKAYLVKGGVEMEFSAITAALGKTLEPFKIPVVYEWIDEIPKTSSGKKQRLLLGEQVK